MSMSSQTVQFQNCAVCGRETSCCHFGALSCKACAAFFRRSVAKKKVYFCERRGNCPVNATRNPKICPACRWQRCIAVGMEESAVRAVETQSQSQPQRRNNPETQQLQLQRRSPPANTYNHLAVQRQSPPANAHNPVMMQTLQTFDYSANFSPYQNHEWLRHLLVVNQNVQHERMTILTPDTFNKKTHIPEISKYMLNDFQFCKMYLDSVGILDIAKNVINDNLLDVIYYWCQFATVFNTLRSDAITVRKMIQVDHSVIEMSEASIREMYATEQLFSIHLDTVANTSLPMWYRAEEIYRKIYALGLTNEEQAFLLIIGMMETIQRLSSEPKVTRLSFKPIYDNVFRSMHMYYRDNFLSEFAAVRIGELIMTLSLINEIVQRFDEHRIIMDICLGFETFTPIKLIKAFRKQRFH